MNNSTLQTLMELSIADSAAMTHNFKHFSYIVHRNKVLSVGRNNPDKTHPLSYKFGHRFSCIHSEIAAIVNFPYAHSMLRKCTMVNLRISKTNECRMSRPCKCCRSLLSAFNVGEVIYTGSNGQFYWM